MRGTGQSGAQNIDFTHFPTTKYIFNTDYLWYIFQRHISLLIFFGDVKQDLVPYGLQIPWDLP